MNSTHYLNDSSKFWEIHNEAREERDKKLARLSFTKKADITERLQADEKVLRYAKKKLGQFGLGSLTPDAMNEVSAGYSFTRGDVEIKLNKEPLFNEEL